MTIAATPIARLHDPTAMPSKDCKRCGVERKDARSSSPICRDCKWGMSREELAAWGAVPNLNPNPRKDAAA